MADKKITSHDKKKKDEFNPYILFLILILLILSKNVLRMLEKSSKKKSPQRRPQKRAITKGVRILPAIEKREETTEKKGE